MLNADPKKQADAQIIEKISYQEAIELAYYGASVIHPKTIQPLIQKHHLTYCLLCKSAIARHIDRSLHCIELSKLLH